MLPRISSFVTSPVISPKWLRAYFISIASKSVLDLLLRFFFTLFIDSLTFQFASYYLNDSIWITKRELFNQVKFITYENEKNIVKKRELISKRDSMYVNLLFIEDILRINSIAPKSYLLERIKSIIYNRRKILLIKQLNMDIINDAVKSKRYELYK